MKVTTTIGLSFLAGTRAIQMDGLLNKGNLPDTGREWVTFDNGIEFLPASGVNAPMEYVRKLSSEGFENNPFMEIFVDGTDTYYDEYAQAWRALGFYIDCDAKFYQVDDDEEDEKDDNYDQVNNIYGCQRYLLWAAVSRHLVAL